MACQRGIVGVHGGREGDHLARVRCAGPTSDPNLIVRTVTLYLQISSKFSVPIGTQYCYTGIRILPWLWLSYVIHVAVLSLLGFFCYSEQNYNCSRTK